MAGEFASLTIAFACRTSLSCTEHQGMTPDEIVGRIPTVTLADVHSALAYYFDHASEIQQEIQVGPGVC